MAFYEDTNTHLVVRKDGKKEYYVELKKELSYEEVNEIQRLLVKSVDGGSGSLNGNTNVDIPTFNNAVLEATIVSWNLPSREDPEVVLPITPKEALVTSLKTLPSGIVVKMIVEAQKAMDNSRSNVEEARFPVSGEGGDPAGEDS